MVEGRTTPTGELRIEKIAPPTRTIQLQPGRFIIEINADATGHRVSRVERDDTIWDDLHLDGLNDLFDRSLEQSRRDREAEFGDDE